MVIIDQNSCIGCGFCVKDCLCGYLTLKGGKAVSVGSRCIACGHCVAVCPQKAIMLKDSNPAELKELPQDLLTSFNPEQFLDFLKFRRSVRQFQQRKIDRAILDNLVEAGRYSPTGSNRQSLCFTIITERNDEILALAVETIREMRRHPDKAAYKMMLENICTAYDNGQDLLFYHAPAVLLIHTPLNNTIDSGIAASRIELLANTYGLGSCYIGFFTQTAAFNPAIKTALNIANDHTITAALALGYPAVTYRRTAPRKPAMVQYC